MLIYSLAQRLFYQGRIRLCLPRTIFGGKTRPEEKKSSDFSLQSVVKYSKVRHMRYTQHTHHIQWYLLVGSNSFYIFNKKMHAAFYWFHGSLMRRTNGRSSIVQQSGALLKPLLVVYFKKMQTIGQEITFFFKRHST